MVISARFNSLTECCTWWLNSPTSSAVVPEAHRNDECDNGDETSNRRQGSDQSQQCGPVVPSVPVRRLSSKSLQSMRQICEREQTGEDGANQRNCGSPDAWGECRCYRECSRQSSRNDKVHCQIAIKVHWCLTPELSRAAKRRRLE